jgi:deleted-in-malignant-brain-tumors protein 1
MSKYAHDGHDEYIIDYDSFIAPNTTDNCVNGDIRLVNGQSSYEGLVEICSDGSWGYICPRYWDNTDAKVVCRQLGYTDIGAVTFISSSSFGKGAGPLHFSNFHCSGSENNLISCTHYTYSCSYGYHAGVICQAPCTEGDIRLVGDSRYDSFGRVEVCVNGTWGTICDDHWDNNDASVVCRQLGFSGQGAFARTGSYQDNYKPNHIIDLNCNGAENNIFDCSYNDLEECQYNGDAYVQCPSTHMMVMMNTQLIMIHL